MRAPWGNAKWQRWQKRLHAGAVRAPALHPARARARRPAALARARAPRLAARREDGLVGNPRPDDVDAGAPARTRTDRGRRAPQGPAPVGPRGARLSANRDRAAGRGSANPRGEAIPSAGRQAREEQPRRAPGRRGRPCARNQGHVPLPLRRPGQEPRPRRGALGLLLPPRDVRPEGEARVRLLRPADPARRPADRPHRAGASTARPACSRCTASSRSRARPPAPAPESRARRDASRSGSEQRTSPTRAGCLRSGARRSASRWSSTTS